MLYEFGFLYILWLIKKNEKKCCKCIFKTVGNTVTIGNKIGTGREVNLPQKKGSVLLM